MIRNTIGENNICEETLVLNIFFYFSNIELFSIALDIVSYRSFIFVIALVVDIFLFACFCFFDFLENNICAFLKNPKSKREITNTIDIFFVQ